MIKSAGATSDDNPYAGPNAIVSITSSQERAPALPELCARIHEKVEAFLNAEPRNERLRAVQAQSRISLDVIEEALQKYRSVLRRVCESGHQLTDEATKCR